MIMADDRRSLAVFPVGRSPERRRLGSPIRKAAVLNWVFYRLVGGSRPRASAPKWKVGIYKYDLLGDFILSIGAIRQIIDIAGEENCVLLHSAYAADAARSEFPNLARIELPVLDSRLWNTWRKLRDPSWRERIGGGVDELLCLRHFRSPHDEVALQMIPSRVVWAARHRNAFPHDGELIRRRYEADRIVDRGQSDADRGVCEDLSCHFGLIASWAGKAIAWTDILPRIDLGPRLRRDEMVICPIASQAVRDLPMPAVLSAVRHAREAWGLRPLLLSPPGVAAFEAIREQLLKEGESVEIRVTHGFSELLESLAASTLVLTADTATAHMAAALDMPMVCLLGGGQYGAFGPWRRSRRQVWLTHHVPCFQCNWLCVQEGPICITRVSGEELTSAIDAVLRHPVPADAAAGESRGPGEPW
jgi:hypothetical protein